MNTFIILAPIVAGAYLVFGALTIRTNDFLSAIAFKVLPFTFGSCSLLAGLKLWGVL